jgi:hypothetical protein
MTRRRQKPENLQAAIAHIANDALVLRQANELKHLRVGWTTWYVMARNLTVFLEVEQGRSYDIRASDFLNSDPEAAQRWGNAKVARLEGAPAELTRVKADASQAATHLSWGRVHQPDVQPPSDAVTKTLLLLWSDFVVCVPEPYKATCLKVWRDLHPRPQKQQDS